MKGNAAARTWPRWLLLPISLAAFTAIWSGWVALGELCGFGPVDLLPGIGRGLTINTAITLPVGAEAYAALALYYFISPGTPERAKSFAGWSALGAMAYGMFGQVASHLMQAHHINPAPWPVVVFVSCMPVAVVMLAAVLMHLLHAPAGDRDQVQEGKQPEPVPPTAPAASVTVPVPGVRQLQREERVGYPVAKKMQARIKRDRASLNGGPDA
jgi:hypothetical protein